MSNPTTDYTLTVPQFAIELVALAIKHNSPDRTLHETYIKAVRMAGVASGEERRKLR